MSSINNVVYFLVNIDLKLVAFCLLEEDNLFNENDEVRIMLIDCFEWLLLCFRIGESLFLLFFFQCCLHLIVL